MSLKPTPLPLHGSLSNRETSMCRQGHPETTSGMNLTEPELLYSLQRYFPRKPLVQESSKPSGRSLLPPISPRPCPLLPPRAYSLMVALWNHQYPLVLIHQDASPPSPCPHRVSSSTPAEAVWGGCSLKSVKMTQKEK